MLYDKFNLLQTIQCIIFQIDQETVDGTTSTEEFGIDILQINGIIRYETPTEIPNVPKWIKGLINLRGQIIPVFDFREFFGFKNDEITENTRIINLEYGSFLIGMIVDRVMEVLDINLDSISEVPNFISTAIEKQFIQGIGRINEKRLVTILDIDNFFSDTELEDLDFISENRGRIKKVLDSFKARAKDNKVEQEQAGKKSKMVLKQARDKRVVNQDRDQKDWEGKLLTIADEESLDTEGDGSFEIELEEIDGVDPALVEVSRPVAERKRVAEIENESVIAGARVALEQGEWERAATLFEQSKDLCIEQGWTKGIEYATMMLEQVNEEMEKATIEASLEAASMVPDTEQPPTSVESEELPVIEPPVQEQPATACEWCGRRFKSDRGLVSHQRSCKKKK